MKSFISLFFWKKKKKMLAHFFASWVIVLVCDLKKYYSFVLLTLPCRLVGETNLQVYTNSTNEAHILMAATAYRIGLSSFCCEHTHTHTHAQNNISKDQNRCGTFHIFFIFLCTTCSSTTYTMRSTKSPKMGNIFF